VSTTIESSTTTRVTDTTLTDPPNRTAG